MTSSAYIEYLEINLQTWLEQMIVAFKQKSFLCMPTPHAVNPTNEYFSKFKFKNDRVMVWLLCFQDLNLINFGALSRFVCKMKDWEAILLVCKTLKKFSY